MKTSSNFFFLLAISLSACAIFSCNPDDAPTPEGQGQMSAIVGGERSDKLYSVPSNRRMFASVCDAMRVNLPVSDWRKSTSFAAYASLETC